MSKVYAECNIVINPTVGVKGGAKKYAQVNMDIFSGINTGPEKPITLVLKGKNFARVMELMTLYGQSNEDITAKARDSVLADEVKDMTVDETAAWVRGNILKELEEMKGGADEDPLV